MKKLFGGILMAVGLLVALGSGICSLAVLADTGSGYGGFMQLLPAVAIVGGIPFAIGVGLFFVGRHLVRSAAADEASKPDDPVQS